MLPCVLPSVRNRRVAALEVSICRLRHGVSDTVAPQFEPADFKEIAAELRAAVWPMPSGGEPANIDVVIAPPDWLPTWPVGDLRPAEIVCSTPDSVAASQHYVTNIRRLCHRHLRRHLIPNPILPVSRIPRRNGKADLTALPDAWILFGGLRPPAVDNAAPSDRLSVRLAQIWYELLGIRPRMGDDFFLCRGHSLLATRLVFEIQQRTRVKIARRDIFRTPTLRGQGALVADQVPRGFDVVAQKLT